MILSCSLLSRFQGLSEVAAMCFTNLQHTFFETIRTHMCRSQDIVGTRVLDDYVVAGGLSWNRLEAGLHLLSAVADDVLPYLFSEETLSGGEDTSRESYQFFQECFQIVLGLNGHDLVHKFPYLFRTVCAFLGGYSRLTTRRRTKIDIHSDPVSERQTFQLFFPYFSGAVMFLFQCLYLIPPQIATQYHDMADEDEDGDNDETDVLSTDFLGPVIKSYILNGSAYLSMHTPDSNGQSTPALISNLCTVVTQMIDDSARPCLGLHVTKTMEIFLRLLLSTYSDLHLLELKSKLFP